jgi:hypothetical protein
MASSFEYLWEAMQRQHKWERLKGQQYSMKQWRASDPLSKMILSTLDCEILHPHLPDIILDYADDTSDDTVPRFFDCAVTNAINWSLATLKPDDLLWASDEPSSSNQRWLRKVTSVDYGGGTFTIGLLNGTVDVPLWHNSDKSIKFFAPLPHCFRFPDGSIFNEDEVLQVYNMYFRDSKHVHSFH